MKTVIITGEGALSGLKLSPKGVFHPRCNVLERGLILFEIINFLTVTNLNIIVTSRLLAVSVIFVNVNRCSAVYPL